MREQSLFINLYNQLLPYDRELADGYLGDVTDENGDIYLPLITQAILMEMECSLENVQTDEYVTLNVSKDDMWNVIHSSILYWKKQLQDYQGKITLSTDGERTHYSLNNILDEMKQSVLLLKQLEESYSMSESSIIIRSLRMIDRLYDTEEE